MQTNLTPLSRALNGTVLHRFVPDGAGVVRLTVVVRSRKDERRPSNTSGVLPADIASLKETKSLKNLDSVALTKQEEKGQQGTGSANAHAASQQEQGTPPLTVYSVRFRTSNSRGAALSEQACVNVCLVAKDGRAAMHRVTPVFDPKQDSLDMQEACEVLKDGGLGADCARGMSVSSSSSSSSSSSNGPASTNAKEDSDLAAKPRVRFQEGSVDEVNFKAPELGKLAGILVGTESGSWGLEEVDVASSRTGAVHRFVCRSLLGAQRGEGACFLKPVPTGSVIYGTGSAAQALTKEEANAKRAANLASYASLKQRLLTTNILLVVSGGGLTALLTGSSDAAASFAFGGSAGVLYQWLLQQGVDSMAGVSGAPSNLALAVKEQGAAGISLPDASEGRQQSSVQNGQDAPDSGQIASSGGAGVRSALGRPFVRLALLAALGFGGASWLQGQGMEGIDAASGGENVLRVASLDKAQLIMLAVGILGFLTYKISLISVSIAPEEQPPPQQQQQQQQRQQQQQQ